MRTKLGRKSQGLVHIFLISLISLYQLFPKWRYKLGHLQMNVNMWGGLPLNWEHLCFPSQPLPHLSLASRATGMDWDAKFCNRQRMHLCKNEEKEWKRNNLIWNFNSTFADLICLRTFPDKQAAGDSFSNILRKKPSDARNTLLRQNNLIKRRSDMTLMVSHMQKHISKCP